jgi:hypothetical protein
MKISELNLSEKANAYVDHGVLRKWRGNNSTPIINQEFLQKVKGKEQLSKIEIELIKSHDNVIIESEGVIEFYNFTGFAKKFN